MQHQGKEIGKGVGGVPNYPIRLWEQLPRYPQQLLPPLEGEGQQGAILTFS